MKIGIDVDDVLCQTGKSFIKYHNEKYGTELGEDQFYNRDLLSVYGETREEATRRVLDYLCKNISRLEVVSGAKEGVERLKKNHELVIVTGRRNDMLTKTKEWIENNFQDTFSEIIATNLHFVNGGVDKGEICQEAGIDLIVDDYQGYIIECHRAGIPAILFEQPWSKSFKIPGDCWRAKNWKEVKEIINEIDKKHAKIS